MNYVNVLSMCAAVAVTAGGIFMVGPAYAQAQPVVVTAPADIAARRIGYTDLNLASAGGEQVLNLRVRGAIVSLCNEATESVEGTFGEQTARSRCSNSAWAQAKPQIGRAVQRAREIAFTGSSDLAAAAIVISISQ